VVPYFFAGTDSRDPHFTFLRQIDEWFPKLEVAIPQEVARRLASAEAGGGAVWTTSPPTSRLAHGPSGS